MRRLRSQNRIRIATPTSAISSERLISSRITPATRADITGSPVTDAITPGASPGSCARAASKSSASAMVSSPFT